MTPFMTPFLSWRFARLIDDRDRPVAVISSLVETRVRFVPFILLSSSWQSLTAARVSFMMSARKGNSPPAAWGQATGRDLEGLQGPGPRPRRFFLRGRTVLGRNLEPPCWLPSPGEVKVSRQRQSKIPPHPPCWSSPLRNLIPPSTRRITHSRPVVQYFFPFRRSPSPRPAARPGTWLRRR